MNCCCALPCFTGFGFLEFEEKDDAAAAIDNMHNSEIYGRVLRVNYAQPMKIKGGDKGWRYAGFACLLHSTCCNHQSWLQGPS